MTVLNRLRLTRNTSYLKWIAPCGCPREGTMQSRGLFVGLTTIDVQYLVEAFPASNSKTVAGQFAMSVGGPATNAAIAFSHLGGKSHLMSAIGNNQFTPFIESELQLYNVEFMDLSPEANQLPTMSSIVTTHGCGHRAVITTASSPTASL